MDTPNVNERRLAIGGAMGKRAMLYLGILVFAFALLLLVGSSNASAADNYVSGSVNGTWVTGDNIYVVADATVDAGNTLTIQDGVNVFFDPGTSLTVNGRLLANATGDNPLINFTSNATSPAAGDWNGIIFQNAMAPRSFIEGAHVSYAVNGVVIDDSNVALSNIVIDHLTGTGLVLTRTVATTDLTITLDGLIIADSGDGIDIQCFNANMTVTVLNCILMNIDGSGIYAATVINGSINLSVDGTEFVNCGAGIDVETFGPLGDATVDVANSDFADIGGSAVSVVAELDSVEVTVTNVTVTNALYAIYIRANADDINLAVDGLTADGMGVAGIQAWCDGLNDITLSNIVLNDTGVEGLGFQSWSDDIVATVDACDLTNITFLNAIVFNCFEGGVDATVTDVSISGNMIDAAIWVSANLSATVKIENVAIAGAESGVYLAATYGTASLDLVDVVISDPNLNQGILVVADEVVVFNAINLTVIGADSDGVSVTSHHGAVEADISGADIESIGGSGLLFYSEWDYVNLTLTDSAILGCGLDGVVAQGVTDVNLIFDNVTIDGALDGVLALSTDGNISANFSDVTVMECETGIRILAPNGWIRMVLDPSTVEFVGTGIYLAAQGAVDLSIIDSFVGDAGIGIEIHSFDGGINILLDDVVLGPSDLYGLFADADNSDITVKSINATSMTENDIGWYLVTSNGSVSIDVEATTFELGETGILVESSMDLDVNVAGSSFLGQGYRDMNLNADANITLNVEGSIFDGQTAENAQLFYPAMSDGQYIIIQPEDGNWTAEQGLMASLPFGFMFNGVEYTELNMSLNGWMAFGADGSPDVFSVYTFDPDSPNLIAPAQEFWTAYDPAMDGYFHGMGYKYDGDLNAVIFQWFVWDMEQSQLKNVFEVILYANGEIEFRYAMMDGLDLSSYDFGINMYNGPNWNLETLGLDALNMDFQSVFFTTEMFSDGAAIFAIAGENMVATIDNSSFGHYLGGGVLLVADDGVASIEMKSSVFSFIYATSQIMGAFVAVAMDDVMTADISDNSFDTIGTAAIVLFDAPDLGGVDSFVVTNNHFNQVIITTAIVSLIEDEDQVDRANYTSDKTFAQNDGTHVGIMAIATIVMANDVAWTIHETDVIEGNNFTGDIDPWLLISLSGLTLPYLGDIEFDLNIGMMNDIFVFESEIGDNRIVHAISVDNNKLSEGPLNAMFDMGSPMIGAVTVLDIAMLDGASLVEIANVSVANNEISAFDAPLASGVNVMMVESLASPVDGLLDSTVNVTFINNTLVNNWGYGIGLGFTAIQTLNNGNGQGMLNVEVAATGNMITGFEDGIQVGVGSAADNLFGDVVSNLNARISDNEVHVWDDGIDVNAMTMTVFEHYFPPFEQVVDSNATMVIDVEIINNTVQSGNEGIFVGTSAVAVEDEFGVFTNANASITGPVNVLNNRININWDGLGIEVESSVSAMVSMATAMSDVPVTIVNNTVDAMNGTAVHVGTFASASTLPLRFDDQPDALNVVKLNVNGNNIRAYSGIEIEQRTDATGGNSQAAVMSDVTIMSNNIIGINAGTGISVTVKPDEDGAGLGQVMEAPVGEHLSGLVSIANNSISGVAVGIFADSVVELDVSGNTITSVNEGVFIESAVSSTIRGNVIRNVGLDGIHAVFLWNVSITMNTFENIGASGVYLSGDVTTDYLTISNNTFTNLGDSGVEVSNINWLFVLDNAMTNVSYYGVEVNDASNVFIENNTMSMMFGGLDLFDVSNVNIMNNVMSASAAAPCSDEGTEYGIDVDDASNVTVTRNEITGFGTGVEFDDVTNLVFTWNMVIGSLNDGAHFNVDLATISNNVFSGSGNVGVIIQNSDRVIFANNEISDSGMDGLLIIESSVTVVNGVFVDNGGSAIFTETFINWIINGNTTIRNGEIFLVGDLMVMSGGVLTLDGVELAIANDGDCLSMIEVMAGGKLIMINVDVYMAQFWLESVMNDYYEFNVFGTLQMMNSVVGGALELYLGTNSTVDIETSTIHEMQRNGIHIVDCSPVIISSTIISNPRNGIFIEGLAAAPQITDCLIANNDRGIYAINTKLDSITDNVFVLNSEAGIFAEKVSGAIHDNVFLINNKEIYVLDSNVSVWDNMIGYTPIIQVAAQFVPLLQGLSLGEDVFLPELGLTVSVDMVQNLLLGHTGIYAVNSIVDSRGNQFGMLTTAVQVMNSKLTFNDDIRMNTLIVPYLDNSGIIRNMSLPVPVYDGITAKNSDVEVNGGTIEVLDDAIFLDNCTGHITGVTLKAGDFGVYAIRGSNVTIASSTIGKQRADDPSSISVYEWLTVNVKDPWNTTLANVPVTIKDSHLVTDANGNAMLLVLVYVETETGRQNAAPYLVTANFTEVPTTAYPGHASFSPLALSKTVTMNGPTTVVLVPSVIVRFDLIAHAMDENGKNAVNVTVKVFNAAGVLVTQAQSDANGTAAFELVSYIKNADGTTDSSMTPYKVTADIGGHTAQASTSLTGNTNLDVKVDLGPQFNYGPAIIVGAVALIMFGATLWVVRRKP